MDNVRVVTARIKAVGVADGLQDGEFEALVSVFDVEDRVHDVVRPGAFTDTLREWKASGNELPVIWAHAWDDPFAHIGHVKSAMETDAGLLVRGVIDDLDTNPTAVQVYKLLKGRRVTQFSFAYDVLEGGWATHEGDEVYELKKLRLIEVGPCLLGVNPETQLLAVKAASTARAVKAGMPLDAKSVDALRQARASLDEVIAAAESDGDTTTDAGDAGALDTSDAATAADGDAEPAPAGDAAEDGQPAAEDATGDDAAPSDPSAESDASTPAQDLAHLTLLSI